MGRRARAAHARAAADPAPRAAVHRARHVAARRAARTRVSTPAAATSPSWASTRSTRSRSTRSPAALLGDDVGLRLAADAARAQRRQPVLRRGARGRRSASRPRRRPIRSRSSKPAGVPATLQGLVAARLDALEPRGPGAARGLRGRRARAARAAAVYAVAAGARRRRPDHTVLRTLAERELIDLTEGDVEFTFTSEVIREVAYGTHHQGRARPAPRGARRLARGPRRPRRRQRVRAGRVPLRHRRHASCASWAACPIVPADLEARAVEAIERRGGAGPQRRDVAQRAPPLRPGAHRRRTGHRRDHAAGGSSSAAPAPSAEQRDLAAARRRRRRGARARRRRPRHRANALTLLGEIQQMEGDYAEARKTLRVRDRRLGRPRRRARRGRGRAGPRPGRRCSPATWSRPRPTSPRRSRCTAQAGDRRGEAWSLQNLATISFFQGDAAQGRGATRPGGGHVPRARRLRRPQLDLRGAGLGAVHAGPPRRGRAARARAAPRERDHRQPVGHRDPADAPRQHRAVVGPGPHRGRARRRGGRRDARARRPVGHRPGHRRPDPCARRGRPGRRGHRRGRRADRRSSTAERRADRRVRPHHPGPGARRRGCRRRASGRAAPRSQRRAGTQRAVPLRAARCASAAALLQAGRDRRRRSPSSTPRGPADARAAARRRAPRSRSALALALVAAGRLDDADDAHRRRRQRLLPRRAPARPRRRVPRAAPRRPTTPPAGSTSWSPAWTPPRRSSSRPSAASRGPTRSPHSASPDAAAARGRRRPRSAGSIDSPMPGWETTFRLTAGALSRSISFGAQRQRRRRTSATSGGDSRPSRTAVAHHLGPALHREQVRIAARDSISIVTSSLPVGRRCTVMRWSPRRLEHAVGPDDRDAARQVHRRDERRVDRDA